MIDVENLEVNYSGRYLLGVEASRTSYCRETAVSSYETAAETCIETSTGAWINGWYHRFFLC